MANKLMMINKGRKEKERNLKKTSGVANVVADQALRSDADLILVNGRLWLWSFDLLVPIHGAFFFERERGWTER